MKTAPLIIVALIGIVSVAPVGAQTDLPAQVQERIAVQSREMSTVGVPAEAARQMLTLMHRHRFSEAAIARARQETMDCAKAGLPVEPVITKAMEGLAKQAGEQQIVAAMAAVHGRYAAARQMAETLPQEKRSREVITQTIAEALTAGMVNTDMAAVMTQLRLRTREETRQRAENEQLTLQTLQTVRTMARLGIRSAEVSSTVCQALQNGYTHQEMTQLRHHQTQQAQRSSPARMGGRTTGATGKGGTAGGGAGGGGPGGGGPGGGGPGGGGPGGGGPGGGGPGGGGPGGGGAK